MEYVHLDYKTDDATAETAVEAPKEEAVAEKPKAPKAPKAKKAAVAKEEAKAETAVEAAPAEAPKASEEK